MSCWGGCCCVLLLAVVYTAARVRHRHFPQRCCAAGKGSSGIRGGDNSAEGRAAKRCRIFSFPFQLRGFHFSISFCLLLPTRFFEVGARVAQLWRRRSNTSCAGLMIESLLIVPSRLLFPPVFSFFLFCGADDTFSLLHTSSSLKSAVHAYIHTHSRQTAHTAVLYRCCFLFSSFRPFLRGAHHRNEQKSKPQRR
jgi:hypothetical protein